MTHLWLRAEQRPNEERTGLTPQGASQLIAKGFQITVEESKTRVFPTKDYASAGCAIAPEASWPEAPTDAIILGLKELPDDGTPLPHHHVMFGHAFKGQHAGQRLLERFKAGGGILYDLEYLVDETHRRVAAFGYWAGYAGAAVTLKAWAAQNRGETCPPVSTWSHNEALIQDLEQDLTRATSNRPSAIIVGAHGRVGSGVAALCEAMGIAPTRWDAAETAHGGPFPEILAHDLFFNCILAQPNTPIFVPKSALFTDRQLSVIGDIACDPDSDYNPVPLYSEATRWDTPVVRVHKDPVLDIMAIDNLPSLLPRESSEDFAEQLLPWLETIDTLDRGVWAPAETTFRAHMKEI